MPTNSVVIPDLIIQSILNKFIDWLRADYSKAADKKKTFIYKFFKESGISRYQYFEQLVKVIVTAPNNPRHIDGLKLGYNPQETIMPFISISMPSENEDGGYLGGGLEEEYDEDQDEFRNIYTRNFRTTYDIIIGSDNRSEANLLYNFVKAMVQAAAVSMEIEGLKNIKIGGKDLTYDPRIPNGIFFRTVALTFDYETSIPSWLSEQFIKDIRIDSKLTTDQ